MTWGQLARRFGWSARTRLTPREGYALWAETYPPWPHNRLMEVEQAVMTPLLNRARPTRALDVGTGSGRYLPLLQAAGSHRVVGLDLSWQMLTRDRSGVPRVCGDAYVLPFSDGQFDLVCASLMVGDVADVGRWVSEMARVLVPGGRLVYSDFHPTWHRRAWRRTFRTADGRLFELPFHPHSIEEHLARLAEAAFLVQTVREPRADVAGRARPVVAVFEAEKRGRRPARR